MRVRVRGAGAQRQLGFAQGRAAAGSPPPRQHRAPNDPPIPLSPPAHGRWWEIRRQRHLLQRDLRRHFPHFAERNEGMEEAGLARRALLTHLLQFRDGPSALRAGRGEIGGQLPSAGGDPPQRGEAERSHTARARPPTGSGFDTWWIRDICGDGSHRAITLAPPWLASGLLGVNERGLVAALQIEAPLWPPAPASSPSGISEPAPGHDASPAAMLPTPSRAEADIAAPAFLLLDQCLERWDTAETALRWCATRPGNGRVLFVFADAAGCRGALYANGSDRVRLPPEPLQRPESPEPEESSPNGTPRPRPRPPARFRLDAAHRTIVLEAADPPGSPPEHIGFV